MVQKAFCLIPIEECDDILPSFLIPIQEGGRKSFSNSEEEIKTLEHHGPP